MHHFQRLMPRQYNAISLYVHQSCIQSHRTRKIACTGGDWDNVGSRVCLYAGIRGIDADIIFLEEAAFIPVEVIQVIILPLARLRNAALIGISTPGTDEDGFFNEIIKLKDPNDPNDTMFDIVTIGLVCEACKRRKVGEKCQHLSHLQPSWISSKGVDDVRAMMKGMSKTFMQENMGMHISSMHRYFKATLVERVFESEPVAFCRPPRTVYIGIDPSGGGNSNYAIASTARGCVDVSSPAHETVIVGLDHTDSADPDTIDNMIVQHIYTLRKHPTYRDALFVVFVEANMSNVQANRVRKLVSMSELGPIIVPGYNSKGEECPGVYTTSTNKEAYIFALLNLLQEKQLSVAKDFVSVTSVASLDDIKMDLSGQMRYFRRIEKQNKNPEFIANKVVMTGKSSHHKDDLLMALMFSIYFRTMIRAQHRYQSQLESSGMSLD